MRIILAELTNSSGNSGSVGGRLGGNSRHGPADLTGHRGNPDGVDRDGQAWCMQDGRVYEQGDDWDVDSCTTCTCKVSKHKVLLHTCFSVF